MSEEEFTASSHYGAGMFIRSTWYLWWHEGHHYDAWPAEKPALVAYLNSLGIVHPDDMSCILMACFYRKIHNLPFDLEQQVERYKDYWKGEGYADGIPK